MKIIAVTQKGPNKSENEDRIIVGKSILASGSFATELDEGILAVADGVGGNSAGAVASHLVAKELSETTCVSAESMQRINEKLLRAAEDNEEYHGMATTLAGITFRSGSASLFNVGNSRVYLLQGGKYLKQLTTDDTTLNYLLVTGQIRLEEADSFDRRNEITACFGGGKAGLYRIKINNLGTVSAPVMLTSDGIHDYLSVDQMEDIILEYGLTLQCCEAMIALARGNGSADDVSVIIGGV